jgi:large subunit ribosomal protein L23
MNKDAQLSLLVEPRISEKATRLGETNRQYVYRVRRSATKAQIKRAVEEMFSVQVESVQTCNVRGKTKLFRRRLGVRAGWKKAYVKLMPGFTIDFSRVE